MKHRAQCKCVVCEAGSLEEGMRKFYEGVSANIEKYGRSCVAVVGGDGFPWTYTIGNSLVDQPELLMIGINPEDAIGILNFVSSDILPKRGSAEGLVDLGAKCPLYLLEASEEAKKEHSIQASEYLGGRDQYRLAQLVVPDLNGRFPWDEGCEKPYRDMKVWRRADG